MEKFNLTKGNTYFVKHRDWQNKMGKYVKRQFLFTEKRFGDIVCYVFTSKLAKGVSNSTILSIPTYDLMDVKELIP